jgi:hypothetical protein
MRFIMTCERYNIRLASIGVCLGEYNTVKL